MPKLTPTSGLIVESVIVALLWGLMAFRAVVLYRRTGKFYARDGSDWGLLVVLLTTMTLFTQDTWIMVKTLRQKDIPTKLLILMVTPDVAITMGKIAFSQRILYYLLLWGIKQSFLAMYFRMVLTFPKKIKIFYYFIVAYVFLTLVANILIAAFWCRPLSLWWDIDITKRCSTSIGIFPLTFSTFTNITTDLLLIILPLLIFRKLQLRQSQIYAGAFVIFLGATTITFALVRYGIIAKLILAPSGHINTLFTFEYLAITLTHVEGLVAGWAACFPALRVLLLRNGNTQSSSSAQRQYMFSQNRKPREKKSSKKGSRALEDLTVGSSILADETLHEVEKDREKGDIHLATVERVDRFEHPNMRFQPWAE